MFHVFRVGCETRIKSRFDPRTGQVSHHFEPRADADLLGTFPTAAAAAEYARQSLARDRMSEFVVCQEDGTVLERIYDFRARIPPRRIDPELIYTLVTAPILGLIATVVFWLEGAPLSTDLGLGMVIASICFYLVGRRFQNQVESIVFWLMWLVLLASWIPVEEKMHSRGRALKSRTPSFEFPTNKGS